MAKKLYFKIGEACKQLGIQPYVLRYWETEFPFLNPDKSKSGQRIYSQQELEIIGRVKHLLYEEHYTIAGAKKKLESELAADGSLKKSVAKPGKKPPAKQTAAKAEKSTAAAAGEAPNDRLERLERGLGEALALGREILDRLQPSPAGGAEK